MDKATRVLFLYRAMMGGATVVKANFCAQYDVSPSSFDRYVRNIRTFLREDFSNPELIYDRKRRVYRMSSLGINDKRKVGTGEAYILVKLLLDSCQLRTDDREEIVKITLSQLSASEHRRVDPVLGHSPPITPCLSKASVKLVEDILLSIERKDRISLQFGPQYLESGCVPYSIEFRGRESFLVAWELRGKEPKLYVLDDIRSYIPANFSYVLSEQEKSGLQELIDAVADAAPNDYQSFIYEKELVT